MCGSASSKRRWIGSGGVVERLMPAVAMPALGSRNLMKCLQSRRFFLRKIDPKLPRPPDPAPVTDQGHSAKQVWLQQSRVEPALGFCLINTVERLMEIRVRHVIKTRQNYGKSNEWFKISADKGFSIAIGGADLPLENAQYHSKT